jgi:FkbM family methyltransferase
MAEQAIFDQIVGPGMLVVEVGANIGAHTIDLARMVGSQGEVHAFEPQRIVFQTLCANLALNQCANVFARQVAVGASGGSIMVPPVDPGSRNNFGGISLGMFAAGEAVQVITIDSLDLPACHVLKIDVEGMETEVLRGATSTIDMYRPVMYVENDRAEKSEELLTVIERLGYVAYWHLAPLFNPDNFAGDPNDIFPGVVSINVLCVPKETKVPVTGLRKVSSPHDRWQTNPT